MYKENNLIHSSNGSMSGTPDQIKAISLPGFRPFLPGEESFYFGRERDIKVLKEKIASHNFIALTGDPGVGKSSLINCGLLPVLKDIFPDEEVIPVLLDRMQDPYQMLASALSVFINENRREVKDFKKEDLAFVLGRGMSGLVEVFDNIVRPGEHFFLVMDNFEEIFCMNGSENANEQKRKRDKFLQALSTLVLTNRQQITILVSIGSDYVNQVYECGNFGELVKEHTYRLKKITGEQLSEMLNSFNSIAGLKLSEFNVSQLVSRLEDQKHPLHLLQYAFRHLTRKTLPPKPEKIIEHLTVSDELDALISVELNSRFLALGEKQRRLCARIFKSLFVCTEKGGFLPVRTTLRRLSEITDAPAGLVEDIIRTFSEINPGIFIFSGGRELTADTEITLSHQLVFSWWDRYRKWLEEEVENIKLYMKLSKASELYQQGKGGMLSENELDTMLDWRKKNNPVHAWASRFNPAFNRAMIFLELCEKKAHEIKTEQANRKAFIFTRKGILYLSGGVAGVALIVFILVLIFAILPDSGQDATAENLSAKSVYIPDSGPEESRLLPMETIQKAPAVLQGERQENIASTTGPETGKEISNIPPSSDDLQTSPDQNAEQTRTEKITEPVENETIPPGTTLNLKQISDDLISESLGESDAHLKGLLAYQAYLFRLRSGNTGWNPELYKVLEAALRAMNRPVETVFRGHTKPVNDLALRPGTRTLYSAGSDGRILEWDYGNPARAPRMITDRSSIYELVAVSRDGIWLAAATFEGRIHLVNLKSGSSSITELQGHEGSLKTLAFSPDNSRLISTGGDRKIRVWNLLSGDNTELENPYGIILDTGFSPDNRYLAGCTRDGILLLWEMNNLSNPTVLLRDRTNSFYSLEFGRSGNLLCVGDLNGMLTVINYTNGTVLTQLKNHSARILDIAFNSSGSLMATAGMDGNITIIRTGFWNDEKLQIKGNRGFVLAVGFLPGEDQIVWCNSANAEIVAAPVEAGLLADRFCNALVRNFTREEWQQYVGSGVRYELTCPGLTE